MSYNIELSRKAEKYLKKLDKKVRTRIQDHIRILSENPRHPELDIKRFHAEPDLYRLRVGDYRVLYSVKDDLFLIIIVKIGSRGDVYK